MDIKISICIPSYNRPDELKRLLNSIDSNYYNNINIIVCEDMSPKRDDISIVVGTFAKETKYKIDYYENESNLGYDKNIKNLVSKSKGDFIIFMGDDDIFVPNALDKMVEFLSKNKDLGYVLKSHRHVFNDGTVEKFRYFNNTIEFEKGLDTYVTMFRKSVFISGFTINRHYIKDLVVDDFDGGLLYQMYLLAETAMNYRCAYFDEPLTQAFEDGIPYFGSSETEKGKYTPGTITVNNSLNFLDGFFDITRYIDKKYNVNSTDLIKKDMSKYFYPSLAIQRNKGVKIFLSYVRQLNNKGFNCTPHYYLYAVTLVLFGKSNCDKMISYLKNRIGYTPHL